MKLKIRKSLKALPPSLQKVFKSAYGLLPASKRLGNVFWKTYIFLQESQWWGRKELEDYQQDKLGSLLNHAFSNVPYYRKVFNDYGIMPGDIQTLGDLKKIPVLTKDIVRTESDNLTAQNYNRNDLYISHTSGTTGKPLQWYISLEEDEQEYASICHQWSRIGFKPGDSTVQLRGNIINTGRPFEYDPIFKVLRLSPKFHSRETVSDYISMIKNFKSGYIHGYPSVIALFASLISHYKLCIPFELKAVLFASELYYPWERNIVQEVFKCRAFSHYGSAEKVVLAGECEKTNTYHPIPHYGITEIDKNSGEIIGTSLIDFVTPFIRYKTTDIVSGLNHKETCVCKRQYFPLFDCVEGRIEDFIITPKGEFISPALITHPFKDFKQIQNTQIIQENSHSIMLNIVPKDECNTVILNSEIFVLIDGLKKILGEGMEIGYSLAESIKLSDAGKFRWIISEVSKKSLEKGI